MLGQHSECSLKIFWRGRAWKFSPILFTISRCHSRPVNLSQTVRTLRRILPSQRSVKFYAMELTLAKSGKIRVSRLRGQEDEGEGKNKSHWNNKSSWLAIKIIGKQFYLTLPSRICSFTGEVRAEMVEGRRLLGRVRWLLRSQSNFGSGEHCRWRSFHVIIALQNSGIKNNEAEMKLLHSFYKILTLFYHTDSFVIRLPSLQCDLWANGL